MRRELKVEEIRKVGRDDWRGRKAHPDEKGTESVKFFRPLWLHTFCRKAHPDEKGTERIRRYCSKDFEKFGRKAHPDEKGTERGSG